MTAPRFLKLDPALFKRLPPLRKAAAALAAFRTWRPEASLLEIADSLGVPESTARRWDGWLAELDAPGATDGATGGATGGALSTITSDMRRERGEGNSPPPSLRDRMKKTERSDDQVALLVDAYMARNTNDRVIARQVHGRLHDDLRQRRYAAADAARFLDATPALDGWPSDLSRKVVAWTESLGQYAAKTAEIAAWAAWRRRLANVAAGEPCWDTEGCEHRVAAVDAEAGWVDVRHGGFELRIQVPQDGRPWVFEAEAMPLFAGGPGRA